MTTMSADYSYLIGRVATAKFTSEHWGLVEGEEVIIKRLYWRNGENQLVVTHKDGTTRERSDSFFDFNFEKNTSVETITIDNSDKETQQDIPLLVGVQEAAEILGWDRRKVSTYMSRGSFPVPIQRLASGSIWTRQQIIDYQDETVTRFRYLRNNTNFAKMSVALVVHPTENVIREVINWYTTDGIQYVVIYGINGEPETYRVTECRKDDGRLPY